MEDLGFLTYIKGIVYTFPLANAFNLLFQRILKFFLAFSQSLGEMSVSLTKLIPFKLHNLAMLVSTLQQISVYNHRD